RTQSRDQRSHDPNQQDCPHVTTPRSDEKIISGHALSDCDLPEDAFAADAWALPGRTFAVEMAPGIEIRSRQAIVHPRYGRCTRIVFSLPADAHVGDVIVRKTLVPQP
ncbi:MAG: hypothetical protein ACUVQQ_14945, partial [Thermogutta sp.]